MPAMVPVLRMDSILAIREGSIWKEEHGHIADRLLRH